VSRLSLRVIGNGRAGGAFAAALGRSGWDVRPSLGRGDHLVDAAVDVDLVLIATPDPMVSSAAAAVAPGRAVVAHVAGSLTLDVLAPHTRRASVHPLVSLPNPEVGADRLVDGAWFAVAGHPMARAVVDALGGTAIEVPEDRRAAYHAAAAMAANHLVALLGSVERVAALAGVPLAAYLGMVRGTVDNVEVLGPSRALTGPVARGDWETVARHLGAVADAGEADEAGYRAMARLAAELAGSTPPWEP
jgi:predicted short-subunit dehydrogenase-like oxidoreductase (DUF2520 family)